MSSRYLVSTEISVRFSDTDAMGHVNNARFFSYMEEGRVAYFTQLLPDVDPKDSERSFPFILADIQCSFKSPLFCGGTVVVTLGVTEIRTSSFVMEYELTEKKSGRTVATGKSVQVMYDYQTEKTYPMPDHIRRLIENIEGRTL